MNTRHLFRNAARFLMIAGLLGGSAVTLSACNTMEGAGKDVSSIGHDVSNGANYTQSKWKQTTPQAATH